MFISNQQHNLDFHFCLIFSFARIALEAISLLKTQHGRIKVGNAQQRGLKNAGANNLNRQELLAWANSLLQLNLTKVEQFGTGYGTLLMYQGG